MLLIHLGYNHLSIFKIIELLISCKGTKLQTDLQYIIRSNPVSGRAAGTRTTSLPRLYPPTLSSVGIPRPTPPRSFAALVASFLCTWAGQEEEVERGIAIAIAWEFYRFLSPFYVLEITCLKGADFTTIIISSIVKLFVLCGAKSQGTLLSVKGDIAAWECFTMTDWLVQQCLISTLHSFPASD